MLFQIDSPGKLYIICAKIIFLILILAFFSTSAMSAEVSLAWDPNTESDLAGYKIHYGQSSGNYQYSVDIGNFTSITVSDLTEGQTYYYAATAYDIEGNESSFSEEIS